MAARPIRVRFVNVGEIRMGSPYNACRVVLTGRWVPTLPDAGDGFQDLAAWSPGGEHLALVQWAGSPGFRVIVIDISKRTLSRSRRRVGCCESLVWSGGRFEYTAYRHVRGRVAV